MIIAHLYDNHFKPEIINAQNLSLVNDAVWIDLITPTKEEEDWIEKALAVGIPTQEEMREIELTSRLYMENNVLFMTALMIAQSSTLNPKCDPVTFALTANQLITIRYIEPQSFQMLTNSLAKNNKKYRPSDILIALLEATVDRLADALEYIGQHLDEYSSYVFQADYDGGNKPKPDYQRVMQNIGSKSNLTAKVRESLINFNRLIVFFRQSTDSQIDKESKVRLINIMKDLESLSDYANFISNKINFLLDATLGMISIEQSAIIKIFSVAAVIFLPPTLIASIYGMNFKFMPELSFKWGYELAILLMLISAWIPYKYFKHKGWL
ncbi:magnesium and cobalt transport protein CorA [Legionella busanensis]|uniref:Magnesium transport protein CorA n=1 Tax=Legionella busanensis TaxID=190655 RepID=A0A378JHZ5_9GAMM|nr:magnesium transporter CorA family protein [Legionella busanensis]STX50815.1 magnesium and cobalt transport protein CorA [Legionella busanensis]